MVTVPSLPQAMRESRRLRAEGAPDRAVSVGLVSNVVLTDVDTFMEYSLLTAGIEPYFSHGDYGQIARSMARIGPNADQMCVVLHIEAMTENLPWASTSWSWASVQDVIDFRLSELRGAIAELPSGVRVHLAVFGGGLSHPAWETARRQGFAYIEAEMRALALHDGRVLWTDVQSGLEDVGFAAAMSQSRAARFAAPLTPTGTGIIGSALAKSIERVVLPPRKVLVLDADNTLWGGVVGEDGPNNIDLHPTVYPGNVYFRAQSLYKGIKERGILLAVVSKNEPADLQSVFDDHPYSQLRQTDFVAIKAGWHPKVDSIRELAEELNLGLDSFVFVDDSQVELAAVREQLTLGAVIQVPEQAYEYLSVLPAVSAQFSMNLGEGLGDRTEKYRVRAAAASLEKASHSREEFLCGLQTRLRVAINDPRQVSRVSELSERTNQFNCGLSRYTIGDLDSLLHGDLWKVLTYEVSDRFGSSGVSAAAIVVVGEEVRIQDWWVSCRVLGRGVELAILRHFVELARGAGHHDVQVVFRRGLRNQQVEELLSGVARNQIDQGGERVFTVTEDFDHGDGKWVEVVADGGR